jgi:hypothetical protein
MLGIAACAGTGDHREVSGAEFAALMRRGPDSMSHVEFLGVRDNRAWLTHWRMGLLGGETTDVCSVAIGELPAAEAAALRDGRNPWLTLAGANDPGLRAEEREAALDTLRAGPSNPIVVVLRCAKGSAARVARNHFDVAFTDDDLIPVPVPCDVVLVATVEDAATLRIDGQERAQLRPGRTAAAWHHLHAPGVVDVVVQGADTWQVQLRAVDAAEFYSSLFDQQRSKRRR